MTITSLTVSSKTTKTITLRWKTDTKAAKVYYKIDSGSDILYNQPNATSGSITITGLSENRTYSITVSVENSSGSSAAMSTISVTTYKKASVVNYYELDVGENIDVNISNPSGNTLTFKLITIVWIGQAISERDTILQRTVADGDNVIKPTYFETKAIYEQYKDIRTSSNNNFAFKITDTENNTTMVPVTYHFTGKYPTINKRGPSSQTPWDKCFPWIKVDGEWLRGAMWVNVNGTWKRGC